MRALRLSLALAALIPAPCGAAGSRVLSVRVSPALTPTAGIPGLPTQAVAIPGSRAEATQTAGALPTLAAMSQGEPAQESPDSSRADQSYDGSEPRRALEPAFEPPTQRAPAPQDRPGGNGGEDRGDGGDKRRIAMSFPPAAASGLTAVEPDKAIYGQMKRVRDFKGSRMYWAQFKRGAELDILTRGVNVFGRPTTITAAANRPIGKLTRDDFKGTIPEHQLKAPIRQLRQRLLDNLEEGRKVWNPNDPPVTLKTTVRVVKFKSFIEMYRETHGADAVAQVEPPSPRLPLETKPEGALSPLSLFLPRAVFLDVDLLEGPISPELLSDIMKLQRTGVYFVAFSRKPYASPGSIRERLIHQMSSYQLSILLPIRFMAVTDNGAVISAFPKGGGVSPVDVAAFTDTEMDVLRDASQKAAEAAGLSPRSLREFAQLPVKEAVDEFPGLTRRAAAKLRDPQVRFELSIPKNVDEARLNSWLSAFDSSLAGHGLQVKAVLSTQDNGRRLLTVQKTDLGASMPRVLRALGEKFGLYLNPNDILVLSEDPDLKKANPQMDFAGLTGLKGTPLLENALGLMLGEHRQSLAGDITGSASRMAQFTYDRTRYLSEFLVKQDGFEQNINFFSGHAVHSAMDWLVWNLQNGVRPTEAEYAAHLNKHWNAGLREFKPVGLPQGEDMEGWLRESTRRGLSMYRMVMKIHDRGEVLVGTEIPNFFIVKDYERRSGDLKRRYILHTIFDFITLRPDPKKPGHASLVIYDFKTGPAQSRQKLDKDLQVLTYALFANQRWVGKLFMAPYLSGKKAYHIDDARVEFIYNAIKQSATVTAWDLETIRRKIIGTLARIHAGEQKMLGQGPAPRAKKPAKRSPKSGK